jgi:hypothetical protein
VPKYNTFTAFFVLCEQIQFRKSCSIALSEVVLYLVVGRFIFSTGESDSRLIRSSITVKNQAPAARA